MRPNILFVLIFYFNEILSSNISNFITREKIADLKSKVKFQIYEYDDHPFKDLEVSELKLKLGLLNFYSQHNIELPEGNSEINLPVNFNVKDKWPLCLHSIRDQNLCGSCWAHAASEVLSDRYCIASNGAINVILSPQDMVSCDSSNMGCGGGFLNKSWNYLYNYGIVSEDCYPYTSGDGATGICQLSVLGTCPSDYKVKAVKYKASKFYNFGSIQAIKNDLFENGPVETGFNVYEDFISYKSGIYKKSSDNFVGGHAVKIVGWGFEEESNTEYWVVANSWGVNWGENGYFKFAINNCCNFETEAIAGTPKIQENQTIVQLDELILLN